jgi:hypothetical protein
MGKVNPATNWVWLVSGAMFEMKTPLSVVDGYARMLESEKIGAVTEKQRDALRALRKAAGDVREIVHALEGLASLEGAWPRIETERVPLGPLLTEVADLWFFERCRPIDVRVSDQHDEVIGARRLLQRAVAGLCRWVVLDQFGINERPLSIWVVDRLAASERWIVLAATDDIREAVEVRRESLTPFDHRPRGLSMDLPFADGIVRAHGGQLFALPGGMVGAVVALPRPNAVSG